MGRWVETGDELHPWEWVRDEPVTEALPVVAPLPRRVPGATLPSPAPGSERPPVDDPVLTQLPPLQHLPGDDDAPAATSSYDTPDVSPPTQEPPVSTAKTLVALLAAVLAAILPGLTTDQRLGASGIANIAILAAGAIQVYNASNAIPGWRYAKLVAAAVSAAAVVFISAWTDSQMSSSEWVQIALAILGAIGVYAVPNARRAAVDMPEKRLAA